MPGVLTFDPKVGAELRLIGGWDHSVEIPVGDGSTIMTNRSRSWPILLGAASDGRPMTLLDARFVHAKTSHNQWNTSDGPDVLHLAPQTVMVGCHLGEADAVFVAGAATIENLTSWSDRIGIDGHRTRRGDGKPGGDLTIARLEPLVVKSGNLTIKLHHLIAQPRIREVRAERIADVKEHTSIEFVSAEPQALAFYTDLLGSIADLVSLSALKPSGLVTLRVYLPAQPERYPAGHPLGHARPEVQVFQRLVVKARPDDEAEPARNFLLTLRDRPFEDLLPLWLDVREKFAAARSMILGLHYVTDGYLESRLVTAVSAAESMHRALDPKPPIPQEEFKELRKQILAVDPAWKTWLAERFNDHTNVPTLRERLLELAERVGPAGAAAVADIPAWATTAKNARNTIAHAGAAKGDFDRLHAVVETTSAVVILNLLYELGVPKERLLTVVREHPRLSFAAELAQEAFGRT
ncbi:hypothetical protein BIV01_02535 [Curtobacterium sp. MCBA15_013]|nr:hypothetical protein BIV01_02535 [Curtobacterium sp. MCBA15_013]